jgi:DNA polymerase-3 subunit alpha
MGVFQLESPPMRALLRSLAPTSFEDVSAVLALYRPGPMSVNMHYDYADRKNNRQPVEYFHPDAEGVLGDTYGLMIYQESVMRVAQKFAGYSLAEADSLRKAMGKKSREVMAKERSSFEAGCERMEYGRALGEKLFDVIAKFADYAFNKSHTFGYGLVTYQTAYLKAHYPVEYMACLLTSVKSNLDKAAVYLSDARAMAVKVLTPDINRSITDFAALAPSDVPIDVELPSAARARSPSACRPMRNVGEGLVELLLRERDENGPFDSFHDFVERVPEPVLNKRTVESLIKAGAFDSAGPPAQGSADGVRADHRRHGGAPPRARPGRDEPVRRPRRRPPPGGLQRAHRIPALEFDKSDRLKFEKEMLGLYISDHPLLGVEAALRRKVDCSVAEAAERTTAR